MTTTFALTTETTGSTNITKLIPNFITRGDLTQILSRMELVHNANGCSRSLPASSWSVNEEHNTASVCFLGDRIKFTFNRFGGVTTDIANVAPPALPNGVYYLYADDHFDMYRENSVIKIEVSTNVISRLKNAWSTFSNLFKF